MAKGKEVTSRAFNLNPRFGYLTAQDRYLFDIPAPRYKFNVIGTGNNGCEHISVTMLEGHATIHGVYDPNPGSIALAQVAFQRFRPGQQLKVYDSLEAACNDPEVDALIIATPNYTHIEVLREAVKSGKNIFLEKPMATTIKDAYEMVQIAASYPALLQIGLQYRYKSMYVESIHEAQERKSLGAVKMVNITEHRVPFLDKVNQWNKFSKYSGGTLVEKCCHYFDLLNLFSQSRPLRVFGAGSQAVNFRNFEYNGEKSDILDNAIVNVDYENGVRGTFNLCMFAPMFYEEITICGDEGYLKAYEREDFLSIPRPSAHMEILRGERYPARVTSPCYPPYIEESGHNGATFFEHINLIDNLDGKPTNAATVAEGFWAVVVGVAAEESVKTGQPVMVDKLLEKNSIQQRGKF